jgi:glycosyltransferase involved in cell wall biosynthesis
MTRFAVSPDVTVVIPCFNDAHYLRSAIDSALGQGSLIRQLIVVDDGSTDATPDICASYGSALSYIRQPNAGLSAARNRGILHADGEFIHFLDADDALAPGGLARLTTLAVTMPEAAVFSGGWQEIGLTEVQPQVCTPSLGPDPFHALFDPLLVGPPCRYMVRRAAVLDCGLFDPRLHSCEDWDLWLRLALLGYGFETTPDVVAVYRNRPGSMSKDHARMWRSGSQVLTSARRRHACQTCGPAYRRGLQRWREYCYLSTLRQELRLAVDSRRFGRATIALMRAVSHDPSLVRQVARSAARNLRSREAL